MAVLLLLLTRASFAYFDTGTAEGVRENIMAQAIREQEISLAIEQAEAMQMLESVEAEKKVYGITFKPSIQYYSTLDYSFNDNIFRTEHKAQDDSIVKFNPGAVLVFGQTDSLQANTRDYPLIIDVGANIIKYFDNGLKRQNPYVIASSQLGKGRHKLKFDYTLQRNTIANSDITVGTTGFVDYKAQKSGVNFENMFGHLGVELGFDRSIYNYEGEANKSANTYRDQSTSITAFLIPSLMPKTRFLMEFDYGKNNYYKADSSASNSIYKKYWVGMKERITRKTSGLIKFGYQDKNYKGAKDRTSVTVKIDLTYAYSPLTSYFLTVSNGGTDSSYRSIGYVINKNMSLGYQHTLASNRKLTFSLNLSEDGNTSNAGLKDKTYSASTGLQYAFRRWLKATLQYSYKKKTSNVPEAGYKNNIYTLKTDILF